MRAFDDRNPRHSRRKTSIEPGEVGEISEASLKSMLAAYAVISAGSEQRWRQLRKELIQKAAAGSMSSGS